MKIGERIARVLKDRGWNQADLARATKLPKTTINHIITGATKDILLSTLQTIADELRVSVGELLDDDGRGMPELKPEFVQTFRALTPADRAWLIQTVERIAAGLAAEERERGRETLSAVTPPDMEPTPGLGILSPEALGDGTGDNGKAGGRGATNSHEQTDEEGRPPRRK